MRVWTRVLYSHQLTSFFLLNHYHHSSKFLSEWLIPAALHHSLAQTTPRPPSYDQRSRMCILYFHIISDLTCSAVRIVSL